MAWSWSGFEAGVLRVRDEVDAAVDRELVEADVSLGINAESGMCCGGDGMRAARGWAYD
jgi:hypothetical protein